MTYTPNQELLEDLFKMSLHGMAKVRGFFVERNIFVELRVFFVKLCVIASFQYL